MKSNQTRLRVAIAGCHRMLSRTKTSHNFEHAGMTNLEIYQPMLILKK